MAVKSSLLSAVWLTRGSVRLIVARWLLALAVALPAMLVGQGAIGDALGRRPYFAEASDPLPMMRLARFLGDVPGSVWGTLAVGAVVAWWLQLILTAAAVELLRPDGASADRPGKGAARGLRDALGRVRGRFTWPYVRVVLLAMVLLALGAVFVSMVFGRIADAGHHAGWPGKIVAFQLPLARMGLLWAWASVVGTIALWCRIILVADDRRRVRRTLPLVFRLFVRRLFASLFFHWVLALASVALGAVVLVAWRQSVGSEVLWFVAWQVVLLLQAFLWHWRVRAAVSVWWDDRQADLRAQSDEPWHVFQRLLRRPRSEHVTATAASPLEAPVPERAE